ncbi:hypothetical protein H5410_061021 [Solanum commersonii]|uniref:Uncharacterized protein n=1 Tax=Solanum commersonii TaxID=4109 RepID=A0A9J5W7D6_SOLCO|nr:hypothetical protein H5410_061021 [Solanum commersonii]
MINEKKKRSVFHNVSFRIEPSKDHAEEPTSDPYKLSHKYQKRLYGWLVERRQCENRAFDMYYYHKSKRYRYIVKV